MLPHGFVLAVAREGKAFREVHRELRAHLKNVGACRVNEFLVLLALR
jgi:hypothetical protein